MTLTTRLRWLRVALVFAGVLCLGVWPLTQVWPSGWSWAPRGSHSEMMIVVIYAVLGVFLLLAARDPLQHRSLISFTVWSSVAHGALMAWQALGDPMERGHFLGDVPALLIGALVLALLMPRRKELVADRSLPPEEPQFALRGRPQPELRDVPRVH